MATIKVTRPKLSVGEKVYFGSIFKGMIVTPVSYTHLTLPTIYSV